MADHTTREVILQIMMRVTRDGEFSHTAIREALDAHRQFTRQEKAFVKAAAGGTLERMIELDYIIDQFASVKTAQMKPAIRNILRTAVYQMRYMDSVPPQAACNEAVKLAQKMGFYNLKGFVNGVLRTIARSEDRITYPPASNRMEYLSVKYSMPRWIVKIWSDEFGPDITETVLEAFLKPHPLTVRLPENEEVRRAALDSLKRQGVVVKKAPYLPYAYYLSETRDLTELAAFRNGKIYPQDISSMLVAECAAPKAGDNILDLCAAPGGKSLHLADKMNGFGMVEARDVTDEKVDLIRENIQRMDCINVHAVVRDATLYDTQCEGKMDIVLCDVPCSGLGVAGRKPDIKYRLTRDGIEELVLLQRSILNNAAAYVRPGGTLIYSTCTIGHMENEDNIRWFEQNYPFRLESLDPYLPRDLHRLTTEKGYLQLLPGIHETDGFFIARFRKESL